MLKLTLAYDGTAFYGSQYQSKQGQQQRTVQGELEGAISRLVGQAIRVTLAGRTDSGVHAEGQVAAFQPPTEGTAARLKLNDWQRALNAYLPPDLRIWQVAEAADSFHPRFDAKRRTYEYAIWNGPAPSPLRRFYSYHVASPLDVNAMDAAAANLVGEHNFASFAGDGWGSRSGQEGSPSTVRLLYEATCFVREVAVTGRLVLVRLAGNAFLPHMVRNIVGTLLLVGSGRLDLAGFAAVLAATERKAAGPTAPPQGLCLVQVEY